jgi:hypothetical protein
MTSSVSSKPLSFTMLKTFAFVAFALAGVAAAAASQQLPAIRPLGPVAAVSSESFGELVSVRHLKTGVLVNDVRNRRLLLFDSTLANPLVVADSTPATATAYSGRSAGLIAYRADSSLFVDAQSLSMLVIDPAGKVARVMSVPRSQDAMVLGNPMFGTPSLDASGRLVYRGMPRPQMRMQGGPGTVPQPPEIPDSAAIVRIDLASRQVDTVAFTKTPRPKVDIQRNDSGRVNISMVWNPLPVVDDWAVLSDGSVALVRGRDYHIDWVRPDGTRESSAKIPFEWQRLTDEDKVAFMDSLKAARERMTANTPAPASSTTVTGGPGGPERREMVMIGAPGGGGAAGGIPTGRGVTFVPANELPDYKPPFFVGNTRADADGHLWIRTIPTKGIAGGPVYDVINAKGELVDRVQVPKDRAIVGFGPGGVVYLLATDGTTRKLERARFK